MMRTVGVMLAQALVIITGFLAMALPLQYECACIFALLSSGPVTSMAYHLNAKSASMTLGRVSLAMQPATPALSFKPQQTIDSKPCLGSSLKTDRPFSEKLICH